MANSNWKIVGKAAAADSAASTGPRTEAGKAVSSANATTHGLSGTRVVLRTEDPEAFQAFRRALELAWMPADARERRVFEQYVNDSWRLDRCRRVETALLDSCLAAVADSRPELSPDEALAFVFSDDSYTKKMRLFLRYQTSIERSARQALTELRKLQAARKKAVSPTPDLPVAGGNDSPLRDSVWQSVDRRREAVGFVSKS